MVLWNCTNVQRASSQLLFHPTHNSLRLGTKGYKRNRMRYTVSRKKGGLCELGAVGASPQAPARFKCVPSPIAPRLLGDLQQLVVKVVKLVHYWGRLSAPVEYNAVLQYFPEALQVASDVGSDCVGLEAPQSVNCPLAHWKHLDAEHRSKLVSVY